MLWRRKYLELPGIEARTSVIYLIAIAVQLSRFLLKNKLK
jgi:hypothetical protein